MLGEDGAPAFTMIEKGGASYVIVTDRAGTFAARAEDLGAVMRDIGSRRDPAVTLTRGEDINVDGYAGATWFLSDDESSDGGKSYVISPDPALAPLARVWLAYAQLSSQLNLTPAKEAEQLAVLFKTGAPVVLLDIDHLKEVKAGPITDADFALPPTLLDRAAIRARLEEQNE